MRSALLCIGLLACSGDDTMSSPSSWSLALTDHPASMLGVWAASANDVWVVGSRTELAGGPTIFRYDGAAWNQIDSGQTSLDLWVVFGFDGGDVFVGGSGGTILRYRGGAFERMTTPRMSGTIFGIWGAAPDDVWAVGTAVSAGAIVWHFDGTSWSEVALPADAPNPVFKVAGRGASDVWMSAASGNVLSDNGSGVTLASTGATGPLFSVAVTSESVVAAGGDSGNPQLVERASDGAWTVVSLPNDGKRWRGLASGPDDLVYVVGEGGSVGRKQAGAWESLTDTQTLVQRNFHAAWIDPAGGMWGVGGDFDRPDPKFGFILYYGTQALEEVVP